MAKKPKLTPWFPGSVKPVHVGVYQRTWKSLPFSFWDGRQWLLAGYEKRDAMGHSNIPSSAQSVPWRGLSEKPQ